MVITTRQKHQRGVPPLNLLLKSQAIEQVSEHRHLGVIIDDQPKWQAHNNCITNTVCYKCVFALSLVSDTFLTLKHAKHSLTHIFHVSNKLCL